VAVIAAFDLASNVGVALGEPGGVPRAWSYRLPKTGNDVGRYLDHFSDWLIHTLNEHQPTDLFFESPFARFGSTRKLTGLACIAELIAFRRKLPCKEATNSEIAKYFIGQARFKHDNPAVRRQMKKDAVVAKCKRLGWTVPDNDAADAAALWCFAEHLLCPGLREINPLFVGSAA
jgi:Holliday junction resolvasome RuvABC endonuclease subunit